MVETLRSEFAIAQEIAGSVIGHSLGDDADMTFGMASLQDQLNKAISASGDEKLSALAFVDGLNTASLMGKIQAVLGEAWGVVKPNLGTVGFNADLGGVSIRPQYDFATDTATIYVKFTKERTTWELALSWQAGGIWKISGGVTVAVPEAFFSIAGSFTRARNEAAAWEVKIQPIWSALRSAFEEGAQSTFESLPTVELNDYFKVDVDLFDRSWRVGPLHQELKYSINNLFNSNLDKYVNLDIGNQWINDHNLSSDWFYNGRTQGEDPMIERRPTQIWLQVNLDLIQLTRGMVEGLGFDVNGLRSDHPHELTGNVRVSSNYVPGLVEGEQEHWTKRLPDWLRPESWQTMITAGLSYRNKHNFQPLKGTLALVFDPGKGRLVGGKIADVSVRQEGEDFSGGIGANVYINEDGHIVDVKFDGSVGYHPTVSKNYWGLNVSGVGYSQTFITTLAEVGLGPTAIYLLALLQ